jgi:hypothetical protein
VVAIIMSGTSTSPELMRELRKLFDICGSRNITLRPQYIRSHLNVLADKLSGLRDHDDWKLNPKIFQEAATRWGTPEVDRFATANNAQCKRFATRGGATRSPRLETLSRRCGPARTADSIPHGDVSGACWPKCVAKGRRR